MNKILFEGCASAVVTPFRNGKIDFDALGKILDYQLNGGIKAFVVLGTTGEASTMEFEEEDEIIRFCKAKINGCAKMIVGTGSNDTQVAVKRSVDVKNMGADGLLVVTPYYNKCTQKGLIAHFTAIADAAKLPVILYNIPGRTGMNMVPATVLELAKNPYIAGLKESNSDIAQVMNLARLLRDKIAIYSGDDSAANLFYAHGCHGVISVAANIVPQMVVEQYNLYKSGKVEESLAMHEKLFDLYIDLFQEVNPICIKAAMHYKGLCSDEMRMPLTTIEEPYRKKLIQTLKNLGV